MVSLKVAFTSSYLQLQFISSLVQLAINIKMVSRLVEGLSLVYKSVLVGFRLVELWCTCLAQLECYPQMNSADI